MKIKTAEELSNIAKEIRKSVLESISAAGSGHTGGSLGMADIFTALYFSIMNHDPKNPNWESRDRLILSIGHIAPILYASLAHSGYFTVDELITLRKLGSRLQGHPGRDHGLPGIELSAGSLGQGVGVSVGMAIAAKHQKQTHKIYCIIGDGELQEGSVWEATMSAAHYKLDNLIWIVDRNNLQIDGKTEEVMGLDPLNKKFEAFGWDVLECNGNNMSEILSTFSKAHKIKQKPIIIIAKTLMGKGVKSIENDAAWHGKAPNKTELIDFISQLDES